MTIAEKLETLNNLLEAGLINDIEAKQLLCIIFPELPDVNDPAFDKKALQALDNYSNESIDLEMETLDNDTFRITANQ